MIYGSVCSGIEAATVAWHPLGWSPAFFSEIEKFPSKVLAHHYGSNMPDAAPSSNGVPNYGDMNKFKDWHDHAIDILVGGTPCQSFSIAGLRKGLADPRGNLMLTYLAIARRYQPRWLVWENVPGVLSSNKGRDFAAFIRGLEECGYHAAWRVLDAQYVRVDGFGRAVPQRRRRVFVVGYLGDWRRSAAVLFERESMSGHPAPSRQSGETVAPTISARPTGGGGLGTDFDLDGGLLTFDRQSSGEYGTQPVASTVSARDFKSPSDLVAAPFFVPIAFMSNASGANFTIGDDLSPTLKIGGAGGNAMAAAIPYTLAIRGRNGQPDLECRQDGTANAILTPNGGRAGIGVGAVAVPFDEAQVTSPTNRSHARDATWAIRRLMPIECERLQGFPDNYTNIPGAADGPRYKALGNSMACNVMRWIGRRIEAVEAITALPERAAV